MDRCNEESRRKCKVPPVGPAGNIGVTNLLSPINSVLIFQTETHQYTHAYNLALATFNVQLNDEIHITAARCSSIFLSSLDKSVGLRKTRMGQSTHVGTVSTLFYPVDNPIWVISEIYLMRKWSPLGGKSLLTKWALGSLNRVENYCPGLRSHRASPLGLLVTLKQRLRDPESLTHA